MEKIKQQMLEASILYYKKNFTQQQIADKLGLTRQTVSKLLNQAVQNKIVEINIVEPEQILSDLQITISKKLGIDVYVGGCSYNNDILREETTVRRACSYLLPLLKKGNLKIGISWGKTIEAVINNLQPCETLNNIVFPLFGETSGDKGYYYTNKLVSDFAYAIGGKIEYAMFPYLTSNKDAKLIKQTTIYKNIEQLWGNMDITIVGIGNKNSLENLQDYFVKQEIEIGIMGDIATHLFNKNGEIIELYNNALCASFDDIKKAEKTIAISFGADKVDSIISAVKTGAINILITDEYTAKEIVDRK